MQISAKQLTSETADVPERVVANADQFNRRLAIGARASPTHRVKDEALRLRGAATAAKAGVAIAQTTVAASVLAPTATLTSSPLVFLGLAAPVTPIGWVVAAGLLAGGAYYGVSRWMASKPSEVDVIPKFLKSDIDVLGMTLLDMHAALALRLAAADGKIDRRERKVIRDHFHQQWGYDPAYLRFALPKIEADALAGEEALEQVVARLAAFQRKCQDCAQDVMDRELLALLKVVAAADGVDAPEEQQALATIERSLVRAGGLSIANARDEVASWGTTLYDAANSASTTVRDYVWWMTGRSTPPSEAPDCNEKLRGKGKTNAA
jgi:tellurite resistance protein